MLNTLLKAALLVKLYRASQDEKKNQMRGRSVCRKSKMLPCASLSVHGAGVSVTCHLVKEFQRRYPALFGPGNNYKACGYLRTPSDIYSRVVLARNVPPNSP